MVLCCRWESRTRASPAFVACISGLGGSPRRRSALRSRREDGDPRSLSSLHPGASSACPPTALRTPAARMGGRHRHDRAGVCSVDAYPGTSARQAAARHPVSTLARSTRHPPPRRDRRRRLDSRTPGRGIRRIEHPLAGGLEDRDRLISDAAPRPSELVRCRDHSRPPGRDRRDCGRLK